METQRNRDIIKKREQIQCRKPTLRVPLYQEKDDLKHVLNAKTKYKYGTWPEPGLGAFHVPHYYMHSTKPLSTTHNIHEDESLLPRTFLVASK